MSTLFPFLVVDQNYDQVLRSVKEKLTGAGFRVVQTFNLQIARQAHLDCPCPNHGTTDCSCQMVILLVYGRQEDPATLILHSQDETTCLSLSGPESDRATQNLGGAVRRTLLSQMSNPSISLGDTPHAPRPTV